MSCVIEEVAGVDLSTDEGHDKLDQIKKENDGRIPWPAVTDAMLECAAYIEAIHANPAGGTGGPLHILTDDNNVEDHNLDFCRKQIPDFVGYMSTPAEDERVKIISAWILDLMAPMNLAERQVTIGLADGGLAESHGRVYMPATEFPIWERIEDEQGNYVGSQWGVRQRLVEANHG